MTPRKATVRELVAAARARGYRVRFSFRPWKTSPPLTRRRLRQQVKHMLRQHHQPAWQRLLADAVVRRPGARVLRCDVLPCADLREGLQRRTRGGVSMKLYRCQRWMSTCSCKPCPHGKAHRHSSDCDKRRANNCGHCRPVAVAGRLVVCPKRRRCAARSRRLYGGAYAKEFAPTMCYHAKPHLHNASCMSQRHYGWCTEECQPLRPRKAAPKNLRRTDDADSRRTTAE